MNDINGIVSVAEKNRRIDEKLRDKGRSHLLHSQRKEPTLYLLKNSYAEGCRTLLDIGCNGGEWMKLSKEIGYTVTGVDHVQWDSVDIVHDCNNLDRFNTNMVDVVQITEVMEHLDTHPQRILKQCKRIARHSVIASTPGVNSKWGGVQSKEKTRVTMINYNTHKWFIPLEFFYQNACIVDDVSGKWNTVRIRV